MKKPLIIAHRGASGYYPEHTLKAYIEAIKMGADFIEPDLCMSKDGALIVRHDIYLSDTTNVAEKSMFHSRKRPHIGFDRIDWWVEDFTLAELKTLKARQPFKNRDHQYDDTMDIVTFDEVLTLAKEQSVIMGRPIGVYPETKSPSYLASIGLDFKEPLLKALNDHGVNNKDSLIYVQSFEPEILQDLGPHLKVPRILLLDSMQEKDKTAPITQPTYDVDTAKRVAEGIGPWKALLAHEDGTSTALMEEAKAEGLEVHAYTFRNDQLPRQFKTPEEEYLFFMEMGLDAFFTDFTDTAVAARKVFLNKT